MKARTVQREISFFLCLALLVLFAESAYPQESYPTRPVTFIIPTPSGSGADLLYRVLCAEVQKFLGQPVVPVNKPGASHVIGMSALAAAKPDGYTIGYAGHLGSFLAPYTEKVPYHPVKDFTQIMQFGYLYISVVVKGDSPFKNFGDVVAYARQNPKKLTYGSAGANSFGYLAIQQIAKKEKVQFTFIPFKGGPETESALLGGHILFGCTAGINSSLLESGMIRMLFLIAESPSDEFPKVPTLKDLGYDIPAPMLLNVAGPKSMPETIVKKLEDAFTRAMKEPAFLKIMKENHYTIFHRNSKEATDYVANNYELFGKLLKEMQVIK